jgi:signal transduction histidine kinase
MRRLLVLYGTALTSVLLVAFLVPLGLLARSLAHDRAIEAARQEQQSLSVIVANTAPGRLAQSLNALNTGQRKTTVFLPGGRVVGAPTPRTDSVRLAATGRAFTASARGGVELLLPVAGDDGTTVIRTFVPDGLLTEGVRKAWLTLAAVGILLLFAAVVVADRIAARLSRSVRDLAEVADRVGQGDLAATVTPTGPREVATVGRVLNLLGARIAAMLADERELGADLSHRLRTPVTALRLDVESLGDPEERRRMTEHVDALVDAVDVAVSEARHPGHVRELGESDAVEVVSERARFWAVLAEETGRPLRVDVPNEPAYVSVSARDLGAALDALVDNVFSHTPPGTPFALVVRCAARGPVEVAVEDDGPGIAVNELARRGVSGAGSTGIGLDVARRTAEHGRGELGIERTPAGGARVVMRLPSRPAPPWSSLNPALPRG